MSTETLPELAATLPTPTPAQVKALFASTDPEILVGWGRKMASERIITDTSRLYGLAAEFWTHASPDQREILVGFSDEILAVAVHTALKLQTQLAAYKGREHKDHIRREATAAELGDAWTAAIRRRKLAGRALAPIAGKDPGREAELAGVLVGVEGPEALARSLELAANLGRSWMANPNLGDIVKLTRLDQAWATRLDKAATTLREAAAAEMSRMTARVSQGDLDKLDGENLYLLKLIVDLFDEAHDIDPTIRRLSPITTIRFFGTRRKAVEETSEE